MPKVFQARAPGRLDVMGGIADYSGSLVLQLPLARATTATLEPLDGPFAAIDSIREGKRLSARLSLDEIERLPAEEIARRYPPRSRDHWVSYVAGVLKSILGRTAGRARNGFTLTIESDVPAGKGISSSAALEVACYAVIAAHFHLKVEPEEIAAECQWAENHVAGAPCGIMDQMTSACGRRDHLLKLRCQPAMIEGHIAIPDGYTFYGIDSGVRHAVTGADYGTVRTAAFMGLRIISEFSDVDYLANITPVELETHFMDDLPESMSGREFIGRYRKTADSVTTVDLSRVYPVRVATAHPVYENARVERFAELLVALDTNPEGAKKMGQLMYESHDSYGACGLGSAGTDRLVELAGATGANSGIFGAKITGGGSGGTVALFARDDAEPAIRAIAERYAAESGRTAEVFSGSGDGLHLNRS